MRWFLVMSLIYLFSLSPIIIAQETTDIQDRLDFAAGLYERNMYGMAITEYESLVNEYPKHPKIDQAYFGLGESFFLEKRYEEAALVFTHFTREFLSHKKHDKAQLRLAESYQKLNRPIEANEIFKTLFSSPHLELQRAAAYWSGMIDYEQGQFQSAETAFLLVVGEKRNNIFWTPSQYYLGEIKLNAGDAQAAKTFFSQIRDSDNVELKQRILMGMGRVEFALENWKSASEYFERAIEMQDFPEIREQALVNSLKSLFNLKEFEALIAQYQTHEGLLQKNALVIEAKFLLSNAYALSQDFGSSSRILQALVEDPATSDEEKEKAIFSRAENAIISGNPQLAFDELSPLPPSALKSPDQWLFLKGQALKRLNRPDEALHVLMELKGGYPDSKYVKQALLSLGYLHFEMGQIDLVQETFDQFLSQYPDHPMAPKVSSDLILLNVKDENWQQAISDSKAFLNQYPDHELTRNVHFRLASLFTELGEYEQAEQTYLMHFEKYGKKNKDLFFYRGYNQQLAGNYETSIAHYEKIEKGEIDKDLYVTSLQHRAFCNVQLENFEQAAEVYEEIITSHDHQGLEVEVYLWLADYYTKAKMPKKLRKVIGAFQMRPEAGDRIAEWNYYLGESFRLEDACGEAVKHYEIVVEQQGTFLAEGYLGLGQCYADLQQYQLSQEALKKALKQGRGDHGFAIRVRMYLGQTLEAQEEFLEAAKAYLSVAILYDDVKVAPEALYRAGQAFENSGRRQEAMQAYKELKDRFPNHPYALEVS